MKQLSNDNRYFNERMEQVNSANEKRVLGVKQQLVHEREMKSQALGQLENMRLEIKAIEGKDLSNNELWKDKCKELFEICKDLQKENEDLKVVV